MKKIFYAIHILLILFVGCQTEDNRDKNTYHYIHLSHIRTRDSLMQDIDSRVKKIDLSKFDMVLIGGDLCEDTSKDFETLQWLDTIFDFRNPNVLWAMGNHDNTNIEWVEKITERPVDFSCHKNGITFIVLDTHGKVDADLNVNKEQIKLVKTVTDTIQESSHLIVMTHNLNWLNGHPEMRKHYGNGVQDFYGWSTNFAVDYNNWHDVLTPMLQRTQRKGVQVICLAGDIGNFVQEFEEFSADGIVYLASGINPVDDDVKFLLFKHVPPKLDWEFVELEEYLELGQAWEVTREIIIEP